MQKNIFLIAIIALISFSAQSSDKQEQNRTLCELVSVNSSASVTEVLKKLNIDLSEALSSTRCYGKDIIMFSDFIGFEKTGSNLLALASTEELNYYQNRIHNSEMQKKIIELLSNNN